MSAQSLKIYHQPKDRLRMTVDDNQSYHTVVPVWAAPVTHPKQFLSLLNANSEEIILIKSLDELDTDSRASIEEELRRRYLTATVSRIVSAKVEFGATYWSVDTERGHREFVAQSLQENAQWLSDTHLLIVDIDGNRFEIPDIDGLDQRSQDLIYSIL